MNSLDDGNPILSVEADCAILISNDFAWLTPIYLEYKE